MTRGQAIAAWFDGPAAEYHANTLKATAGTTYHELFAQSMQWVAQRAGNCEQGIDAIGVDEFVKLFGLRKPYAKPQITRRDFEHLIDLECRANPNM